MTQFTCPDCRAEFQVQARLERHILQSHPQQFLPSQGAASIAQMLEGASFPATADELIDYAREHGDESAVAVVQQFRGGTYRSMADVARELKAIT